MRTGDTAAVAAAGTLDTMTVEIAPTMATMTVHIIAVNEKDSEEKSESFSFWTFMNIGL